MPRADSYGVTDVLELVTEVYGLTGETRGIEYDMICPNPKHLDSSPSCSVNLETGYWNCFSCGVGGDIVDLGVRALGKTYLQVQGLLRPTTPDALLVAVQRRVGRLGLKVPTGRKRGIDLPEYQPLESHPDLRKRLFTPATIEQFGLGWVPEQRLKGHKNEYTIRNSIAIPIKSADGELLAYCYRRTTVSPDWQPRYLYTPDVEISELWFGVDQCPPVPGQWIAIVEGALDAMWLSQNGIPALALLGSKMGDRKIMWLQSYAGITTFPDYDQAGVKWEQRMLEMLSMRMPMRLARYREWMLKKTPEDDGSYRRAKDPEEVLPVDLEVMFNSARWVLLDRLGKLTPGR
jgi:DNA primase